jgi:hypothetical protein
MAKEAIQTSFCLYTKLEDDSGYPGAPPIKINRVRPVKITGVPYAAPASLITMRRVVCGWILER